MERRRPLPFTLAAALTAHAVVMAQVAPPTIDVTRLSAMTARSIGPAVCSGRIGAVAGVPGDPRTIWVGAASGGVWKSTDGGVRFTPVFDEQDVASIGAIAIDPRCPDQVWIGSGEGNPRNSASVGRGLYRTWDGGKTWQKLGLERTERIHRILLHPDRPETAWVAAFGTAWGESEDRGVFRTDDGGRSWQRILFVDPRTGCGDLVHDPHNPDKLFAAMWQHRRWPWAFASGGPGSGLFRSVDGGANWQRLDHAHGLPEGELGRIGLAIAASDPRIVYALTEAKKSALLRSTDGGFHFAVVNDRDHIAPRPFYFGDIRVDPHDADRVYNMHTVVDVSDDGGRTFRSLVGWDAAHPDHHALWIDPFDPQRMLDGNDGGVYESRDRGATWRFCGNLPIAQYYHVAVDHDVPYHVYGGLQDNGSWRGPSNVWENGGIRNLHWQELCFGDGFATVPDPRDSNTGYAMSQGGALVRWDLRTGSRKSIRPLPPEPIVELRFHWNAAIALDPFDPDVVYYGSQFVHRSPDRGESWQIVSPDLTTDNPEWQQQRTSGGLTRDVTAAENHCCILTIAPSPIERGVLWVGTDDGRLQVTRDGGESWRSVEDRLPGLPRHTWCPHVEASRHIAGRAYAVFDDHRRADWQPFVYVTEDFGETWRSLAGESIDGYCLVIEEDPVQPDLLWLGTEFGLFVSFDRGNSWQRWRHGVPTCSVMALTTHARDGDLIVGTHGRSLFVLDDMTPLRTLTLELLAAPLHVFAPRPAIAFAVAQSPGARFPGHDEFRGETAPRGLLLQVLVGDRKGADASGDANTVPDSNATADNDDDSGEDEATIVVHDAGNQLVRTFRHGVKAGLNRIVWGLERDGVPAPSRGYQKAPELPPGGREVLPGRYRVTVTVGAASATVDADVLADPRTAITPADRLAKDELRATSEAVRTRLHVATRRFAATSRELDLVRERLALEPKPPKDTTDPWAELRKALEAAQAARAACELRLWGEELHQGMDRRDDHLVARVTRMLRVTGTDDAPNATERAALAHAQAALGDVERAVQAFFDGPWTTFRTALAASGLGLLPPLETATKDH